MERVYVIGVSTFAQMLRFYIEESQLYQFAGYVVDKPYLPPEKNIDGAVVLTFDEFFSLASPEDSKLISSVTYGKMNALREEIFLRVKKHGFSFINFIHPSAVVSSNCVIGEGNIFLESVVVQPFVKIGDGNVFWSNANICHHTTIGSFNFFAASSAVLGSVVVDDRCFIGCNATIRNKMHIKSDTLVGAAAYLSTGFERETVIVPPKSTKLDAKPSDMKL